MNLFDLANLLDNDGNLQNEMMVMAFAATLLSTIPGMYILCTLDCRTRKHVPIWHRADKKEDPRLRECFCKKEVVSNRRNKIHQTSRGPLFI